VIQEICLSGKTVTARIYWKEDASKMDMINASMRKLLEK